MFKVRSSYVNWLVVLSKKNGCIKCGICPELSAVRRCLNDDIFQCLSPTSKGKHSARTFFLFLINYGDDVCIEDESEYELQTIRKQDVRANPGKATPYNKNKECNSLAKIIMFSCNHYSIQHGTNINNTELYLNLVLFAKSARWIAWSVLI